MIEHPRKTIRDSVKDRLTNATAAGSRVYSTRMESWLHRELPAISIYTDNESVETESLKDSPRRITRNLQLAIEVAALASDSLDDVLDALCLQIEIALDADQYLELDSVLASAITSTEMTIKLDGSKPIGLLRMIYSVTYETESPIFTEVQLDDFSTASVQYQLSLENDSDDSDQAFDLIEDLEVP